MPEAAEQHRETSGRLSRLEILKGLKYSTGDGAFATIWGTLTSGAFLTGFALFLGGGSLAIGMLTAVPTLAALVQLISSYTTEALPERKKYVFWYSLLGRMLWLPILLLPFLFSARWSLSLFLMLFTISFIIVNLPAPAWTSWMSDMVPESTRGRYFGQRNMVAGIAGMAVSLPAAWYLDAMNRAHRESIGFAVLFGLSLVGALLSGLCILRQPEPPHRTSRAARTPGWRALIAYYKAPFADKPFRSLLLFNVVFGCGQNIAAPFFNAYALEALHLSYVWLQILAAVTSVFSLASMPFWGYLADKFGNRPLLIIGVWGVLTLPVSWMFSVLSHPFLMWLLLVEISVGSGIFWAVVGLAQFNLLIGGSPPEKTGIYSATMSALVGLASGLAPLLGGFLMHLLSGWHSTLWGFPMGNYQIVFLLAVLLRMASLPLLRPVRDERARSAREVITEVGAARPRDWRHIRHLQKPVQPETRLKATGALAQSRPRLALDELMRALHDPSAPVRAEAARALGEIGDRRAVEPLLETLSQSSANVVEEAAFALGRIGDRHANPVLIELLLDHPAVLSEGDRLAVCEALGMLGGSDAVDALIALLQQEPEPALQEAAVEALGRTGAARALPALLAKLQQPRSSAGMIRTLVTALGETGDAAAAPALLPMVAQADTETLLPVLADTLARLRSVEAAPLLAARLPACRTALARRQTAHACAVLLGAGACLYNLLGAEEMERDAALARMLLDAGKQQPAGESAARKAMAALSEGKYSACLRLMEELLPYSSSRAVRGPIQQTLAQLVHNPPEQAPVEMAALALCLLRPRRRPA